MVVERQILSYCFDQAKLNFKEGNLDKSRDFCDCGIKYLAIKRGEGMSSDDIIEDFRIELWLERFWMFLENKNLML
jgi:hypothetical protein